MLNPKEDYEKETGLKAEDNLEDYREWLYWKVNNPKYKLGMQKEDIKKVIEEDLFGQYEESKNWYRPGKRKLPMYMG